MIPVRRDWQPMRFQIHQGARILQIRAASCWSGCVAVKREMNSNGNVPGILLWSHVFPLVFNAIRISVFATGRKVDCFSLLFYLIMAEFLKQKVMCPCDMNGQRFSLCAVPEWKVDFFFHFQMWKGFSSFREELHVVPDQTLEGLVLVSSRKIPNQTRTALQQSLITACTQWLSVIHCSWNVKQEAVHIYTAGATSFVT